MKFTYSLSLSIAVMSLTSAAGFAQGWTGPPVLVQQPLIDVVELQRFANKSGGDAEIREHVRPVAASAALLRFTPNLAVRQRNLAGFVAKTRAQSPESADQMARLFASTDIFAAMAQGLAPKGLRIDNVADAYTVYWITAWEASRGIVGADNSRAQAQGVKAQVSRALLSAPEFTKATTAQKQELAEALLIQTALISASAEAAASDGAQLTVIGNAVREGAKAMGLDLDAMELGPNGFGPAK
jgi:hypothetical protein